MDRTPKTGEFYRHFKGRLYQVITVAEHTETGEQMVVYQALYGEFKTYVRPLSMFVSEVDTKKYQKAIQQYRFEKVVPGQEDGKESGQVFVSEKTAEVPDDKGGESDASSSLNPNLLAFIEAESLDEKLEILSLMEGKIGQEELDIMYVDLDIRGVKGSIESQLRAVEQSLLMQKRFEGGRLR